MDISNDTSVLPSRKSSSKELDPNEIKGIQQFVLAEKLGQGAFGKVRLATHIITGEKVAIKILEKDKIFQQEDKNRIEKEIKILKMIRHPNLIQLYQVIQSPKLIYLVMEYSPGKDLFSYIVANKKISEDEACLYFQQIIEGVEYCQKLNICHRDLKPENLLLEGKTLKLIDFGLSNIANKEGKLSTACGSPSYAAPEIIAGHKDYFGSRIDVWSCGVILYVMVCGFLPFEDPNTEKLYAKIIEGRFALPSFVTECCKDLIRKIMNKDQDKRLTIKEIKEHPWYNSIPPKVNEGLLSTQIVLPVDEDILTELEKKKFNTDMVRESVILNKNNHLTTSYYLLVKSRIKLNIQSISDLYSEKYIAYIKDEKNQLLYYKNDLKAALEERMIQAANERLEKEKIRAQQLMDNGNDVEKLMPLNMPKFVIEEENVSTEQAESANKRNSNTQKSNKGLQFGVETFANNFEFQKYSGASNFALSTVSICQNANNQCKVFIIVPKSKFNTTANSPKRIISRQNSKNRIKKDVNKLNSNNKFKNNKSCDFDCCDINTLREKRNEKASQCQLLSEKLTKLRVETNAKNTTKANLSLSTSQCKPNQIKVARKLLRPAAQSTKHSMTDKSMLRYEIFFMLLFEIGCSLIK